MTKFAAVAGAIILAILIGGTAGYWYFNRATDTFADCRSTTVGGGTSAIGGPFTLVSEDGETVTEQDVFTKPTLLYFGYTFCPDVCPLDNARNAEALDLVQERGYDAQMAMISIDPERDTPEQMKDFTSYLHEDMIGLTGSPEQVKAASQAYKTYYKKQDEGDDEYYLVDHSTFTYLVLPETGFVEFFKRDDTPEQIADTMSCFIDASS
ncbi:SCO family protein [Maritimibacter sp. UBA3975]|uniref:SCO family protein n=1 Tax=Maritimibacter sp. UBA3975 TaxID=1946833 RepID=UPI000C09D2F3|nr:SCO family protein [Maritimibacter sp. UBA3975]MAM63403.1 SCO family protein [Maritimibacter sp.]|tara:strand:+ start:77627 stop:78253 length:627 start_codon:yes stop_codon:yes gene_type:complete